MALAAASGAAQVQFSGVVPAYIAGTLVTLANPVYYSETVTSAGVTVGSKATLVMTFSGLRILRIFSGLAMATVLTTSPSFG